MSATPVSRQECGDANGFDHAAGLGLALPGAIEGGTVRDAGPNDRQSERDVDRSVHVEQLQGNVPLVMVHRHQRIKLTLPGTREERVRRQRAGDR